MAFLTGSDFESVRKDTLALMYLDPRLCYQFARSLVTQLLDVVNEPLPETPSALADYIERVNSEMRNLSIFMHNMQNLLTTNAVEEHILSVYPELDLSLYTNRLQQGKHTTQYSKLISAPTETVWGPFMKNMVDDASYDRLSLYDLVHSDSSILRASDIQGLLGGYIETRILCTLEEPAESITNSDSTHFILNKNDGTQVRIDYPAILTVYTSTSSTDYILSTSGNQIIDLWVDDTEEPAESGQQQPLTLSMSISKERLVLPDLIGLDGKLFEVMDISSGIIEDGPIFVGDYISDSVNRQGHVVQAESWRVSLSASIREGAVTVMCPNKQMWERLISLLNKIVINDKLPFIEQFSKASSDIDTRRAALTNYISNTRVDRTLSEKMLNIRRAHYRVNADIAYFLLDTSRIIEYAETQTFSSADALRIAADTLRKQGY